ncbi:MAG TPA: hypothetical protein VM097_13490 [Mycobacteriales bacterium]|nr:hypothetical protein [Mycobacteriales bacterium]
MSINEEPMSATEPAGASDDQDIIDLDDVEGHGMREVAAGLGAAAVLVGGASAAAAAAGVHPSLPNLKSPTPSISDPVGTVDRTTDWGLNTTRDLRDGGIDLVASEAASATSLANQQVSATSTTAGTVAQGAERTADAFVDAAGNITHDQVQAATKVAGSAKATTLRVAGTATGGAVTSASTLGSNATTLAGSTTTDAVRKTATVLQLTTSTINALETSITATIESLNPEAGAGTSGMGSSGWVTFSLGGENIASVQLSNGQATITVKTLDLGGKVLQAVYSGTASTASSMHTMTL